MFRPDPELTSFLKLDPDPTKTPGSGSETLEYLVDPIFAYFAAVSFFCDGLGTILVYRLRGDIFYSGHASTSIRKLMEHKIQLHTHDCICPEVVFTPERGAGVGINPGWNY